MINIAPGDLYVFNTREHVGLEWLVVRYHPDNRRLVLLAPTDDFPLLGETDLVDPSNDRFKVVRCGEVEWLPIDLCEERLRVGMVSEDFLKLVRQRLFDLVNGRPFDVPKPLADLDPEYEEWIQDIRQARSELLTRVAAGTL